MTKLIKDVLLLALCGRLLYVEPDLELTILELIATTILFVDFNFREHKLTIMRYMGRQ